MTADEIKQQLASNAREINRLHARIHETVRLRGDGPVQRSEWERACTVFHSRHDQLAFPGGYGTALDRIVAGDAEAIETALCFLESRPYFFRSGYMWQAISRKLKHADPSGQQSARLKIVMDKYHAWRASADHPDKIDLPVHFPFESLNMVRSSHVGTMTAAPDRPE